MGASSTSTLYLENGRRGLPSGGGYAIAVNITVDSVSEESWVTVFTHGANRPQTSNVNVRPGRPFATAAVVPVGADSAVDIFNAAGQVRVLVDVMGYYPTGAAFQGVTPGRVLDTRAGSPTVDGQYAGGGRVAAGSSIRVPVAGRAGVPVQGAAGVFATVTAVMPSADTYITTYPSGAPMPLASNLNPTSGSIVANLTYIPIGTDGAVALYNATGSTDLLVDVVGYVGVAATTFHSLSPKRFLDTRATQATFDGKTQGEGPLRMSETRTVQVAGRAGIPVSATSVVVNLTSVNPTERTFVSAGSSTDEGWSQTTVSTLNPWVPIVTNLAVVQLDLHGNLAVFNSSGSVDLIMDVVGWSEAVVDPGYSLAVKDGSGSFPHGDVVAQAMSANGAVLAYRTTASDIPGAQPGTNLLNVTTGSSTPLVRGGGADEIVLSDDGRYAAVVSRFDPITGVEHESRAVLTVDRSTGMWTELLPSTVVDSPFSVSMSGDGRYVTYTDFTHPTLFVAIWDRQLGRATPLLRNADGSPVESSLAKISGDGRYVVLYVTYGGPIAGTTSIAPSGFIVLDRATTSFTPIPQQTSATAPDHPLGISRDGGVVLYASGFLGTGEVMILDRAKGVTTSLGSDVAHATLSTNGRYVCFGSTSLTEATVSRYDAQSRAVTLLATTRAGGPLPGGSYECQMSGDGQGFAFSSYSRSILPLTPFGSIFTYLRRLPG